MNIVNAFKKSHIQLILTPFDTGPKTLTESLHYRVPFICSNNCSGNEYINLIGKCGIVVNTDPLITTMKDYSRYKPLESPKWYNKKIDYSIIMKAVDNIVDNYETYTSWKWNKKLNYQDQSNKIYNILKGK